MFKVCIIEDEIIIRKGLIKALDWAALDCEVVGEAANGVEGYKLVEQHYPDIIILDVNMPIMNGLEMLEHLPNYMYSIIIISGHSEFEYAKKAITYGVSEYLLKPVDHQELVAAIKRAQEELNMKKSYLLQTKAKEDDKFLILDKTMVIDSFTVTKSISYIQENYHKKITLQDLSDYTGRSSTYINQRFKEKLKMTFLDYLTRFRMQSAIDLMKEKEEPLYEIATLVGYNDYKYFNQVFKKIVKASPKTVQTYYLGKEN